MTSKKSSTVKATRPTYESIKKEVAARLEGKFKTKLVRRRSIWESNDRQLRFTIVVSKMHKNGSRDYWFVYTPNHSILLNEAKEGFAVMCCADTKRVFVIPAKEMDALVKNVSTTPLKVVKDVERWHIEMHDRPKGMVMDLHKIREFHDITRFELH